MSYCLNPTCRNPENLVHSQRCQSCGSRLLLRDRIRLGSLTFNFFIEHKSRILPTVAMELLMQLMHRKSDRKAEILTYPGDKPIDNLEILRNFGIADRIDHWYDNFSLEQKSEILDRFFSRQNPYNHS